MMLEGGEVYHAQLSAVFTCIMYDVVHLIHNSIYNEYLRQSLSASLCSLMEEFACSILCKCTFPSSYSHNWTPKKAT